MSAFEFVIGLEVHVQLATVTKLFCGCPTRFGAPPNSQVCPVCLGLPGVLPVTNERAFEFAIQTALALGCEIASETKFDRKHYFYPDLPKGYQISQQDRPFASGGRVMIELDDGGTKEVRLVRVHLEEDAGKMIHLASGKSQVDFNRAGTPLLEIVSRPDLRSPLEAQRYLKELKQILQYLEVSDCNLEEGSLRVDCNVSVRPHGGSELGVRCEIKNLNSFKSVDRALTYEGARQWAAIEAGQPLESLTLLWDETAGRTQPQRAKESLHDYRFFPEPDLGPIRISREYVAQLREELTELPRTRRERFVHRHGLTPLDAAILSRKRRLADYYEAAVDKATVAEPRVVAIWVTRAVMRHLNEARIDADRYPVPPTRFAELVDMVAGGRLNQTMAHDILSRMIETGRPCTELATELGERISEVPELEALCRLAIEQDPDASASYRRGKKSALRALLGGVMRLSQGKAEPRLAEQVLARLLS